eukprot:TRINITY_DN20055_c0_g1_i2.p3 TRINITY_DN20055_c0_g1~~TRINITY_DN20055_c0_g1_i2.p3  ORF type:complete len:121 (-),score=27.01 TRINITY_DN20055_c0_g1_i2:191-553(-)
MGSLARAIITVTKTTDDPSLEEQRAFNANVSKFLETVWNNFAKCEDDRFSYEDRTRALCFLHALRGAPENFLVSWKESQIRNLLDESIADELEPANRTCPTKLFFSELGKSVLADCIVGW